MRKVYLQLMLAILISFLVLTGFASAEMEEYVKDSSGAWRQIDPTPEGLFIICKSGTVYQYGKHRCATVIECSAPPPGLSTTCKTAERIFEDMKIISQDKTMLYRASYNGNTVLIRPLLEAGVDVNATNKAGFTPILAASQEGHAEIVRMLLEAKADVNKAAQTGMYPLLAASQEGHAEIVRMLLEAKADVNVKLEFKGKKYTALSLAKSSGHTRIVTLLKKYGAKE